MIISVNEHVFDTQQIYRITPVSSVVDCDYDFPTFDFQIYFLNTNNFINIISTAGDKIATRDKFIDLRDKIIKLWTNDDPNIPQFTI